MTIEKDNIQLILDNLTGNLSAGWLYYFCAKSLDLAYNNHRVTCSRSFFMGCYDACLNESVLTLSKLLLDNSDSVSIHYLFQQARNNVESFTNSTPDVIINAVNQSEKELSKFSEFINILKFNRDKSLAHIDRKHLNNPTEIIEKANIDMNEVENCFREILRIINMFLLYKNLGELSLINIEQDVPEDLNFLLNLFEKSAAQG